LFLPLFESLSRNFIGFLFDSFLFGLVFLHRSLIFSCFGYLYFLFSGFSLTLSLCESFSGCFIIGIGLRLESLILDIVFGSLLSSFLLLFHLPHYLLCSFLRINCLLLLPSLFLEPELPPLSSTYLSFSLFFLLDSGDLSFLYCLLGFFPLSIFLLFLLS